MTDLAARNRRTMLYALAAVCFMLALGFASVPLYRIFCAKTGYGGTPARAVEMTGVSTMAGQTMSIRFDSNISRALPWTFRPMNLTEKVTIGERSITAFYARNNSDHPVTGQASFNVVPEQAAPYFTKIQCFCFTQQTLQPGEEVRMPVIFYVDPKILADPDARDVKEITLSYTFYPVDRAEGAR